jgi:2',3'-cyclic-nucleotide 2'-phosphodiesterase (5'-nucleotidase family)
VTPTCPRIRPHAPNADLLPGQPARPGTFLKRLPDCHRPPRPPTSALEIHIAHINDHHSHLEAIPDFEISLDGVPTRVEAGGFPRLTTLFKASQGLPNLLKLHAGDALTGTLYHTLYHGEADAALMNSVCFDAFELGNHEFDEGDAGLQRFLDDLRSGPCRTTVLAANVEAAIGTPLAPVAAHDYLQPYLLKAVRRRRRRHHRHRSARQDDELLAPATEHPLPRRGRHVRRK